MLKLLLKEIENTVDSCTVQTHVVQVHLHIQIFFFNKYMGNFFGDFQHFEKLSFTLAYFKNIVCNIHNIQLCVNWLFMLLLKIPANSKLLV